MDGSTRGTDVTEPVVILDKDLAAKTIEPLVMRIFDQLASEIGLDALQGLLPIDVNVTIILRSGERTLTTSTMESRVESVEAVSSAGSGGTHRAPLSAPASSSVSERNP